MIKYHSPNLSTIINAKEIDSRTFLMSGLKAASLRNPTKNCLKHPQQTYVGRKSQRMKEGMKSREGFSL